MIVNQVSSHQAFFDHAAATWDDMEAAGTRDRLARLVRELGIRPGDTVLDVGCGTGLLFPLLAVATGGLSPVVALDLSAEMLRRARSRGFGFWCLHADAAQLPLKSRAFAWVICNGVFPHFVDKLGTLCELGRVMGASGRLVIFHANGRQAINAIHCAIGGALAHDELPALDQMAAWLAEARLTPLVLRDEPDHYLVVASHHQDRMRDRTHA
jgi:ubiquinone/menaquinone biosynthesis C-methylase UbiE